MRKLRYLSLLVALLFSAAIMGQNTGGNTYDLTLLATEGGSVKSGAGAYEEGTSVTVTANAAATNFVFVGWTDEKGDTLSHELSFIYTMPAKDVTLTANYVFRPGSPSEPSAPVIKDPSSDPVVYNLVLLATEGGSVKSGAGKYEAGMEVKPEANGAATNFVFIGWTNEKGDTLSRSLSFTYIMPANDVTLTANYAFRPGSPSEPSAPDVKEPDPEPVFYNLMLQATEGGSVKSGAGKYLAGTEVKLEANSAATNFVFSGWISEEGDTISQELSFTYTMPKRDITLTATYAFRPGSPSEPAEPNIKDPDPTPKNHTLTVTGGEGGSISIGGNAISGSTSMDLKESESVNITVALSTNFVFDGWYSADTLYSATKDITFTMGTKNVTLTARFRFAPGSPSEPSQPVTKQNELYMMSLVGLPGETINYPIYLNSNDTIVGTTFYLQFPKGITVDFEKMLVPEFVSKESVTYKLLDKADVAEKHLDEFVNPDDYNTYLIELKDMKVPPTHVPLLIFPVEIGSDVEMTRYRIWLSQVVYVKTDGTEVGGSSRNGAINTAYEEPDSYTYIDNLIGVGNKSWDVEQKRQLDNPSSVTFECNMQEIEMLLGCSGSSFVTFKGLSGEGRVTDQLTATHGYWFGHDGYACSATDENRALSIAFDDVNSQIVLTQVPGAMTAGEEINTKVYFTYKYKYYEIAVRLNVLDTDKKTFTITYYVDGEVYLSKVIEYGADIPAVADPVKEGYSFQKWNNMPADLIMPDHDVETTAVFIVNDYTFTFDSNGGSEVAPITAPYGSPVVKPADPIFEGHFFKGWQPEIPDVMPAEDMHFVAMWTNASFVVDGIIYDVSSDDDHMVQAIGVTDKTVQSIDVPVNVANEGTTYSVVSISSNAFADCQNLLEVTFEGVMNIPAGVFNGSDVNTNLFVFAPAGSTCEYNGNVVIGGVAENVTLLDAKPLRLSQEFTANKVSYSRDFTKATYPQEVGGWETIVLPFDVARIENEGGELLTPFRSGNENSKHFWLAGLTSGGFGRANVISANIPYIISMPNSNEYDPSYNISGKVTFMAENVTMHRTLDAYAYESSEFRLVPTYENVNASSDIYAINDGEVLGYHAGAIFVGNSRNVRPFEAYVTNTGNGARPLYFALDGESSTGIKDVLNGNDGEEQYYDLHGRRTGNLHKGIVIIRDKNGVYRTVIKK